LQSSAVRDFEMNIESVATESIMNSTLLRSLDCDERSLWSDHDEFQIQLHIFAIWLSCSAATERAFLSAFLGGRKIIEREIFDCVRPNSQTLRFETTGEIVFVFALACCLRLHDPLHHLSVMYHRCSLTLSSAIT
jgi:hypothetical protein